MNKHLGGRPTKYQPEMGVTAIDLMRMGASKVEVMAKLGITKDTFFKWIKEIPEFSDSIKEGEILCQSWWEEHSRKRLDDPKFNSRLWEINMRNRFRADWSNVQDHNVKLTLTDADVIEKANQRIKELQQKRGEEK